MVADESMSLNSSMSFQNQDMKHMASKIEFVNNNHEN